MSKITFKGSAILNPVPAVMITSQNKEGKVNVFTVGWIGTACTRPPMITVAIRPERLSYEYIKDTEEFVVNLPTSAMTKVVDYVGVVSGKREDKIEKLKLQLEDSEKIAVPSLKDCPVNIECKLKSITPLGSHDLFLAEVVSISVDENIIDDKGKIHLEKANLIAYSHGEYFALSNNPLGKFGYSIAKKKKKK
ncbi:flavin reductase family protein [Clostridium sp. YIM B02515]|uniref:Flavin reductase family protein n=1 Tax=Clostridium rhizosphaerae TaxID=2803861 RepID=A0ABS1TCU3_9CLOT|nr:flavin reductase family protein [Clostridium rhizosphaerae]MBL4936607.1 flavin reductase family protein [Clostridium rhizosphaerae]